MFAGSENFNLTVAQGTDKAQILLPIGSHYDVTMVDGAQATVIAQSMDCPADTKQVVEACPC